MTPIPNAKVKFSIPSVIPDEVAHLAEIFYLTPANEIGRLKGQREYIMELPAGYESSCELHLGGRRISSEEFTALLPSCEVGFDLEEGYQPPSLSDLSVWTVKVGEGVGTGKMCEIRYGDTLVCVGCDEDQYVSNRQDPLEFSLNGTPLAQPASDTTELPVSKEDFVEPEPEPVAIPEPIPSTPVETKSATESPAVQVSAPAPSPEPVSAGVPTEPPREIPQPQAQTEPPQEERLRPEDLGDFYREYPRQEHYEEPTYPAHGAFEQPMREQPHYAPAPAQGQYAMVPAAVQEPLAPVAPEPPRVYGHVNPQLVAALGLVPSQLYKGAELVLNGKRLIVDIKKNGNTVLRQWRPEPEKSYIKELITSPSTMTAAAMIGLGTLLIYQSRPSKEKKDARHTPKDSDSETGHRSVRRQHK